MESFFFGDCVHKPNLPLVEIKADSIEEAIYKFKALELNPEKYCLYAQNDKSDFNRDILISCNSEIVGLIKLSECDDFCYDSQKFTFATTKKTLKLLIDANESEIVMLREKIKTIEDTKILIISKLESSINYKKDLFILNFKEIVIGDGNCNIDPSDDFQYYNLFGENICNSLSQDGLIEFVKLIKEFISNPTIILFKFDKKCAIILFFSGITLLVVQNQKENFDPQTVEEHIEDFSKIVALNKKVIKQKFLFDDDDFTLKNIAFGYFNGIIGNVEFRKMIRLRNEQFSEYKKFVDTHADYFGIDGNYALIELIESWFDSKYKANRNYINENLIKKQIDEVKKHIMLSKQTRKRKEYKTK